MPHTLREETLMTIGIGLPVCDIPGLLDWARRADAGPFRTLGLLDRLVYDNPEPLVALAAIAGATRRIRVQTEVLLAPLRDTVLLAKQAATLDRISGGRFTLGLGLGGRADDYVVAGQDIRTRGRRLDAQMTDLRRLWAPASDIGPAPARVEVLFGAFRPPALQRVARFGDGFLGAAPPRYLGRLFRTVEGFWAEAGRAGRPRLVAQGNVALGRSGWWTGAGRRSSGTTGRMRTLPGGCSRLRRRSGGSWRNAGGWGLTK
jgi:alkanesulfonate monooxygenase SsuD/methylene tetrahydromethanopterin reductase-like flavin-dependent oxidoreductase (luciferase family)